MYNSCQFSELIWFSLAKHIEQYNLQLNMRASTVFMWHDYILPIVRSLLLETFQNFWKLILELIRSLLLETFQISDPYIWLSYIEANSTESCNLNMLDYWTFTTITIQAQEYIEVNSSFQTKNLADFFSSIAVHMQENGLTLCIIGLGQACLTHAHGTHPHHHLISQVSSKYPCKWICWAQIPREEHLKHKKPPHKYDH